MTTWHFKLLLFLKNPQTYEEEIKKTQEKEFLESSKNTISLFTCIFPGLKDKEPVIQQIINDLDSSGLTDCQPERYTPYGILMFSHVTSLGDSFIQFISEPYIKS
jgi:hypothetical protein